VCALDGRTGLESTSPIQHKRNRRSAKIRAREKILETVKGGKSCDFEAAEKYIVSLSLEVIGIVKKVSETGAQ